MRRNRIKLFFDALGIVCLILCLAFAFGLFALMLMAALGVA